MKSIYSLCKKLLDVLYYIQKWCVEMIIQNTTGLPAKQKLFIGVTLFGIGIISIILPLIAWITLIRIGLSLIRKSFSNYSPKLHG